jgi:hypothetical protein
VLDSDALARHAAISLLLSACQRMQFAGAHRDGNRAMSIVFDDPL